MGLFSHIRLVRVHLRLVALLSLLLICLFYLLFSTFGINDDQRRVAQGAQGNRFPLSTHTSAAIKYTFPLPVEDGPGLSSLESGDHSASRFGMDYLRAFNCTTTKYCDEDSTANLTCFSHKTHDQKTDSFCIGGPATLDTAQSVIKLDCDLRDWDEDDRAKNVPQLHQFPEYWYNTGPSAIFRQHIKLGRTAKPDLAPVAEVRGVSFLVQREDNGHNLWHTMMEIMSLTMSLDVLRMTIDPSTGKRFITDTDFKDFKIVFLDSLEDGPYYDLWTIFAGQPSVRFPNISSSDLAPNQIVVPLPGSSNPFWQGDWVDLQCGKSVLLKTFSRRVLNFYAISDTPSRSEKPFTLTLVDRKHKRRLLDQSAHFAVLEAKYPSIRMQMVDFAALPFSEQIQVSHSTDILVGVHGAGLTHGMFLPPNSTIVEIQPPTLKHKGFNNMSKALGHRYFSRHGSNHDSPNNTNDWHDDDVYLEEHQFLELMEEAIASTIERRSGPKADHEVQPLTTTHSGPKSVLKVANI